MPFAIPMTVIIWGLGQFVGGVGVVDMWGRELVQEIESPDFRSVEAVISEIQGFT